MKRIKRRLLHAIQIFNQLVTAKHLLRDFLRILVGFCLGFLCHRLLSPTTGFGHARTSRGEEWGRDGNRRSDGSWQYAPAAIMECPPCPISCSNDAALAVEQLQLTRYRPRTRFEVIAYNYVDAAGQLYGNYDDEPRIGAPGHQRRALRRLLSHAEQLLQHRHGPACRLGSLLAGYHRYEPGEFAEYVLDVVVKNAVNGSQFVDRLELFTPLGGIVARQGALTPSSETVYFVLPATTSALPRLRAFLRRYGDEFLARGENVHLLVVVTTDDGGRGGVNEVKAMLKSLWREQSTTYVRVIELDGPFSRARSINEAAMQLHTNALMFFCDVDVRVEREFLRHCRLNAKIGRQVYYPVVFSQYNPDIVKAYSPEKYTKDLLDINKYTGMWLHYGFGMACMFGVDYRAVGGFRLDLAGWGGEDVDLYEKHVASDIQVFRAMDPGLIHIYHAKNCSAAAAGAHGQPDQQHMCIATLADTYASRAQLALMLLSGKTPPGST